MKRKLQHSEDNLHTVSQLLKKVSNHVLIGKSQAIHQIMKLVSKVAVSDSISVLITGESGTGKELVARAIHYLSPRKNHFFYDVNCSAVPENLFESEFFGHKKGAFTGATEHKTGWFEIANHGTLFLDEIGDLQMNLQTKFLRVLEQNKIRKVGSNIDIPVDVRIIAATNKNLQTQIEENNFREDLYYRLSNFVIHIPPLRERKEDIPPLVNHFLDSFAKQLKQPLPTIREEVFKALLNYQFPGNVRELKNMVEQAMILCEDNLITLEHFPVLSKNKNQKPISEDYRHYDLNKNIEDLEEKLIRKVLLLTNNDKQKALDYLNISRQSLSRRLEKYHIDIE
jgi:transcriptional regulator with PAS, ATPase and Fis domain